MIKRTTNTFVLVLLTMGIVTGTAAALFYILKSYSPLTNLHDRMQEPGNQYAQSPSQDLPIAKGSDATIDISEMAHLRLLLEQERFDELNTALDQHQKRYEKDYTHEFALYDAYQSFYVTMPYYEALFEKWRNTHPANYQPCLAAAHYYYARGWQSRGFRWKKDTTEEQFKGMHTNFKAAEDHLNAALKINPELMLAYVILIGTQNAGGDDLHEKQAIEKAIALFPYSYTVRNTAMWAYQPRWGGSYRKMAGIAYAAEPYAKDYPVLTALYGAAYYDMARVYESNKEYDKALELYNKSISYGDRHHYYCERAELYAYKLKDYNRALEDINSAISLRPTECDNYRVRSKIYFYQKNYTDALADLETTTKIRPNDPSTLKWRQKASRKLNKKGHKLYRTDLEGAQELYKLALLFNADDHESYYWHGMANYQLKRYEEALTDFQKCIEIDPHYFEAYRMLDNIHANDRQWDTILSYWDAFLEIEPEHAEAYFERSGTHYHNNNMDQAIADLKKACDLGSQKACRQYAKVKGAQ